MNLRHTLAAVAILAVTTPAVAAADVGDAARYVRGNQGADGCYSEPGGAPSNALTAWSVIGLAATGYQDGDGAACLARTAASLTAWDDLSRTILALVAAGRDPRQAGGVDLVARLRRLASGGRVGPTVNSHIFGILAVRAARGRVPLAWKKTLVRDQNPDGSYSWVRDAGGDSNMTAAALWAFRATGRKRTAPVVLRTAAALRRFRNADFGYGLERTSSSDAQSTAWAIGALATLRRPHVRATRFLASLQRPDGSLRYSVESGQTPVWVTSQALAGLAGRALPVR